MDKKRMIPPRRADITDAHNGNDMSEIAGYRVLITGSNGFIGCHVGTLARRAGAEVIGVDLPETSVPAEKIRASLGGEKIETDEVKHLDTEKLKNILADFGPDMIIHLAGSTCRDNSPEAWAKLTEANLTPTASVIAAAAQTPETSRPAVVMPGSQMEYGLAPMPWTEKQITMPANPYGASKLAATELLQAAIRAGILRGCVTRLALVFGPGQAPVMIIPEVIGKALKNIEVRITEGRQRRRFVFVEDVAKFLLTIGARLVSGRDVPPLINAPACEPVSIAELAKELLAILGNPVELKIGALPQRKNEQMNAWPDTTLADSENLIPVTPLKEGLTQTAAWYRNNMWFIASMSLTERYGLQ